MLPPNAICQRCEKEYSSQSVKAWSGRIYCSECFPASETRLKSDPIGHCDRCWDPFKSSTLKVWSNQILCPSCYTHTASEEAARQAAGEPLTYPTALRSPYAGIAVQVGEMAAAKRLKQEVVPTDPTGHGVIDQDPNALRGNGAVATPEPAVRQTRLVENDLIEEVDLPALRIGISRYPLSTLVALLCSYTGVSLALFVGVVLALVAGIATAFGGAVVFGGHLAGSGNLGGFLGFVAGAVAGFVLGFGLIYGLSWVHVAPTLLISLGAGALTSLILALIAVYAEPTLMRLRGLRLPSRRERDVLNPIYEEVARKLGLTGTPVLLIRDGLTIGGAWTYPRHIVISK